MATDRIAVRLIRSAAYGLVDFSKADRFDPNWARHVRALAGAVQLRLDLDVMRTEAVVNAALLSRPNLTPEVAKSLAGLLHSGWADYQAALYPWLPRPKSAQEQAIDEYTREFGDPSSPEYQARVREWADRYAKQKAEAKRQDAARGGPEVPEWLRHQLR